MRKAKLRRDCFPRHFNLGAGDVVEIVEMGRSEEGEVLCYHKKIQGHSGVMDYGKTFIGTYYEDHLWWIPKENLDIIEIPATLENK